MIKDHQARPGFLALLWHQRPLFSPSLSCSPHSSKMIAGSVDIIPTFQIRRKSICPLRVFPFIRKVTHSQKSHPIGCLYLNVQKRAMQPPLAARQSGELIVLSWAQWEDRGNTYCVASGSVCHNSYLSSLAYRNPQILLFAYSSSRQVLITLNQKTMTSKSAKCYHYHKALPDPTPSE